MAPDKRLMDGWRTYGDLMGIWVAGHRGLIVSFAEKLRALWQDTGDSISGRVRMGMLDFLNSKSLDTLLSLFALLMDPI